MPELNRLTLSKYRKAGRTAKTKVCSHQKLRVEEDAVAFVKNIQSKVNAQEGNTLPVSAFKDYVDGSTPSGTAAYEKRGIAVDIPDLAVRNMYPV